MKKIIVCLCVFMVIALCVVSCGYNRIIYDHLTDSGNYGQYNVTVSNILYQDAENVYLYVVMETKKDLAPFCGVSEGSLDKEVDEYPVRLEIVPENNTILYENGFYDDVKIGCNITVSASSLIYQDGEFFFVSAVSYGDTKYLEQTDGLENIIQFMDDNRSLI